MASETILGPQDVEHIVPHIDERSALLAAESDGQDPRPKVIEWGPLSALLLVNMAQPLAFEVIYPFINQMILENGVVDDPEKVGFYSGLVESVFSVVSVILTMPCSRLSDRIGRKPILIWGMLGLSISLVLFGISRTIWTMILSRCVAGALGTSYLLTRTMVGEMTDKSNQGRVFAFTQMAYRTGQIIGLPLGGLLAHPARNFSLFQTHFWTEYPFALPCFVAAAVALFSAITSALFLRETLHRDAEGDDRDQEPRPSIKSILTPSIQSLLLSSTMMCLSSELLFSVFPLFSFTPVESGGLGSSEAAIGLQMSLRAALHIASLALFASVHAQLGIVRLYQCTMMAWPFATAFFPVMNVLARRGAQHTVIDAVLFAFFVVWSLCGFAWPAYGILFNDAAPSAAALATLNGLSQLAVTIPQAIAPASSTTLFALSIRSGIAGGNLIWIVLIVFMCGAAIHSLTLKEPTTDWRKTARRR